MTDVLTVLESQVSEWRIDTVAMLDRLPAIEDSRARVVDAVTTKIHNLTSSCFEIQRGREGGGRLLDIIKEAARLATDLAKQRDSYNLHLEAPGSKFDEGTMADALQSQTVQSLNGRSINGVAFPAVIKRILSVGSEGQSLIIGKAQVIL